MQGVLARVALLGRNRECFVRTDIVVSESALPVSRSPSLLSVKTRVFCSIFLVVVCSFQGLSGNDIRHMTEEDFRLSCCAKSFSSCSFLERNHECFVRTDIAVSKSALSV